jgi:hypothetical protein
MKDYTIEIDGKKIIWFKTFLESGCKKIALRFSGGVESSLILWLLAYFCDLAERYDIEIYTYYMRDCNKRIPSKSPPLREIIKFVQGDFPKVNIKPLNVTVFWSWTSMAAKLEPSCVRKEKELSEKYGIEWFINGINLNHSVEELINFGIPEEVCETRDVRRDEHRILTNTDTFTYDIIRSIPLYNITKLSVKHLYERYGLIDRLYPMTISCMADFRPFPCKTCFWCMEKYAIFGSYDGGIQ